MSIKSHKVELERPAHKGYAFDIESYSNAFMVGIVNCETGDVKVVHAPFDEKDRALLDAVMSAGPVYSFNGNKYDLPVLNSALCAPHGKECAYARMTSCRIIDLRERVDDCNYQWQEHIDLMLYSPMGSLKDIQARLSLKHLEALPFDPNLPCPDIDALEHYLVHGDLVATQAYAYECLKDIEVRKNFAGTGNIAEPSISERFLKIDKRPVENKFKFLGTIGTGLPVEDRMNANPLDQWKGEVITINQTSYDVKTGGLHSIHRNRVVQEYRNVVDLDVASFYPNLMLNFKYSPLSGGDEWLANFSKVIEERLEAKHNGDKNKAGGLKIVINSAYGKMGDQYSSLYQPDMSLRVCLTGQLLLLDLVTKMEAMGHKVIYANTDGIMIDPLIEEDGSSTWPRIQRDWEENWNLVLEASPVERLWLKDVSNYMHCTDGKVKSKGLMFSQRNPRNNGPAPIIYECLCELIQGRLEKEGIIDWLKSNATVTNILAYNSKKRWYYTSDVFSGEDIHNKGRKISGSAGGKLLMELPDKLPTDIDWQCYKNFIVKALPADEENFFIKNASQIIVKNDEIMNQFQQELF